jgi:uncharacterized protein with HEPN domain
MSRDWMVYVEDMRVACQKIMHFTEGLDHRRFLDYERTYDAVLRNLTILGQAAKQIPEEIRRRRPEIEWRKIAGLRDIAIHTYFDVDDEIIWDVVRNKVPILLAHLDALARAGE